MRIFALVLSAVSVSCLAPGVGRTAQGERVEPTTADASASELAATDAGDSSGARCSEGEATDAGKPKFHAFARHRRSGQVDRVGFRKVEPDGYKDAILDLDYEGPAFGFILKSASSSSEGSTGRAWDRLIGVEKLPAQKHVTSVFVYEGDRLLNAANEPVILSPGRHKLTIHLSGPHISATTPWRVYAILPDCRILDGPALR